MSKFRHPYAARATCAICDKGFQFSDQEGRDYHAGRTRQHKIVYAHTECVFPHHKRRIT